MSDVRTMFNLDAKMRSILPQVQPAIRHNTKDINISVLPKHDSKKIIHGGGTYAEIPKGEWASLNSLLENETFIVQYITMKDEKKGNCFLNGVDMEGDEYVFRMNYGKRPFKVKGSNIKKLRRYLPDEKPDQSTMQSSSRNFSPSSMQSSMQLNAPSSMQSSIQSSIQQDQGIEQFNIPQTYTQQSAPQSTQQAYTPMLFPLQPISGQSFNPQDKLATIGEDMLFDGPGSFRADMQERVTILEAKVKKQNDDMVKMFEMLKRIHSKLA